MAAKKAKQTPASQLSFSEAVAEVEEILAGLERENVDIDRLVAGLQADGSPETNDGNNEESST